MYISVSNLSLKCVLSVSSVWRFLNSAAFNLWRWVWLCLVENTSADCLLSVALAAFSAPLCSLPPSVHENGHSATYCCQFQSSTCPLGSSREHSGEGRSRMYQSCEQKASGSLLSSLVHSARWHSPFTATTYLVCLYYTLIIKPLIKASWRTWSNT